MEGFMYRFKHIHGRVRDIVRDGEIGEIRYVDFNWCFNIRALVRSAFRLRRDFGGGVLYDLAIYGIDFLRYLFDEDPVLLQAMMKKGEGDEVEMFSHSCWVVGGTYATVTAGYVNDANAYTISGERGSLYVPGSVSGRKIENVIQVHLLEQDRRREERFAPENAYVKELEYFARCIEENSPPVADGRNMIANLRLLEEVQRRQEEN
jgi:xylose dehydrogenase (NAD/NADP)